MTRAVRSSILRFLLDTQQVISCASAQPGLTSGKSPGLRDPSALGGGEVSGVFEEFEHQLVAWRRKYEGRPRREMLRLLLLALEREEIVSVSYREDVISRRLRTMPISA